MFLWAARAQKWGYETLRYCKANESAEMETLQCGASCFLRTVVKRNHSQSHGSNAATRLQTDSILYLLCLLGDRQGAKTMQKEAPTASNKMQGLDAESFACDGAFPSHAEKKTNPKKKVQKSAE